MYKTGLLRINLLVAAILIALRAITADVAVDAALLWAMTAWLAVTAMRLTLRHRRFTATLWQLLPGLLLAALLWTTPERHVTWLWAWAILLMWPQPPWMLVLHGVLAAVTWYAQHDVLRDEPWWLVGLLLAGLMVLGLSRSRALQAWRFAARHRASLIAGWPLWPRAQLERDLDRERRRATRESVHAELLLLRLPPRRLFPLAGRLRHHLQRFENCYRLDRGTLGILLISRDAEQSAQRRQRLLDALEPQVKARAIPLPYLVSLTTEQHALSRQSPPLWIKESATNA
ncbi:hypothetical protein [Halomonas caseinilytica]|uniref:GGDEF domain-containing protein, diguanylate cyclase (C-di-GMP synthetase) or its enzymatically inactive variants n=1 Tax=Halomonas caseinilytica TaxID=438744 RepID=A0A1M6UBZ4_9GAMM|nr:hypothetical protein [Halomonas caseinilytica]SEM95963.1 hypothetical protein SAMN04487952_108167 [Halomonas caseinilytica]SHK66691.1 hypothetical protein SAMN05192556_104215 [Halomonas caseinilytica]